MPKIIDYTLIVNHGPNDLRAGVRNLMTDGWQPFGSVAINSSMPNSYQYAQAMVKYEEPPSGMDMVWGGLMGAVDAEPKPTDIGDAPPTLCKC